MLLGTFFSVVLITITISRLGEDIAYREAKAAQKDVVMHKMYEPDYNTLLPGEGNWFKRFTHRPNVRGIRRIIRKYLFFWVLLVQIVKVKNKIF